VIRSSSLIVATGIGLLFAARLISPQDASAGSRVIEIRAYTLKPGTRESFHDLFVRQSLPLLRRHNVDVIAYGPSLHDALSYYLVRSFSSLDDRMRSEDAFYASKEWREGPRDRVLAAIETYSTVVVSVDPETVRAMRHLMPELTTQANQKGSPMEYSTLVTTASDVTTLLALNEDYIRSVESSDVQRFREMLAADFMCSLPDGTHLDRDAFSETCCGTRRHLGSAGTRHQREGDGRFRSRLCPHDFHERRPSGRKSLHGCLGSARRALGRGRRARNALLDLD
jgi:NIPSNAP